jgi:hypothetical protein
VEQNSITIAYNLADKAEVMRFDLHAFGGDEKRLYALMTAAANAVYSAALMDRQTKEPE